MPYKTSYYRNKFYRRGAKFYKRKTATLSRYNTYKNRNSAAQAMQIYSLARRINRIQKLNKPEIKLAHFYYDNPLDISAESNIASFSQRLLMNSTFDGDTQTNTAFDDLIDGKFARLNSMQFTMSFRYDDAAFVPIGETGNQRLPQPIYLRLLFVQFKSSRGTTLSATDLFDTSTPFSRVRGPLADGTARVVKVLSDKKLMVNYNHQTINRRVNFNYLRNYYKPANESIAKGDVWLFVQCWRPTTGIDDRTTSVNMTINVKTAYTDA